MQSDFLANDNPINYINLKGKKNLYFLKEALYLIFRVCVGRVCNSKSGSHS